MRDKIYSQLAFTGVDSKPLGELLEQSVSHISHVFEEGVTDVLVCTKIGENKLPYFSSAWFVGGQNLFYEVKLIGEAVSLDRAKIGTIHHVELASTNWDIAGQPSEQAGITIRIAFENRLSGTLCGTGKSSLTVLNFYKQYFMPLLVKDES